MSWMNQSARVTEAYDMRLGSTWLAKFVISIVLLRKYGSWLSMERNDVWYVVGSATTLDKRRLIEEQVQAKISSQD